ncbi:hypothetical protein BKA64DRAFT_113130 [Cadophora sp. MPI-SDFR-AT-0126]|nr:hypothetical protein BKA64DRAFT_113130 [Leotiomycetes sp. MPI-SDFR-AT-0126]
MEQQTYTREEFLLQQQYYLYSKRRVIFISVFLTLSSVLFLIGIFIFLETRLKRRGLSNTTEGQLYQLEDRNLYIRQNGRLVRLVPESSVGVMGRRWSWWSKRRSANSGDSTRVNSVVLQEEGLSPMQREEERISDLRATPADNSEMYHREEDIADRRLGVRNASGV